MEEYLLKEQQKAAGKSTCFVCGQIKSLTAFGKTKHNKSGHHGTCKICRALSDKNTKLKVAYGIDLDIFQNMFTKQGNKCAICFTTLFDKFRPSVDHCHKTGKIRGLLCNNCNRAIGLLKDDIGILYAAIRYLKTAQNKSGEFGETPAVDNPEPSYSEIF